MRMWMVQPEQMCRQHLLGEHVELHMLVGTIRRHKSLQGYVDNGLIEPLSIHSRHEALVEEMTRRGYSHHSPIPGDQELRRLLGVYSWKIASAKVDQDKAHRELCLRCPACWWKRKRP